MIRKEGIFKSNAVKEGIKFREPSKICSDCNKLIPKIALKCAVCIIPEESLESNILRYLPPKRLTDSKL